MNIFQINDNWQYFNLEKKIKNIDHFFQKNKNEKLVIFNFEKLDNIDSSGIILLIKYLVLFDKNNIKVEIQNINNKHKKMLDLYKKNYIHKDKIIEKKTFFP